jgi:hypothetical protein
MCHSGFLVYTSRMLVAITIVSSHTSGVIIGMTIIKELEARHNARRSFHVPVVLLVDLLVPIFLLVDLHVPIILLGDLLVPIILLVDLLVPIIFFSGSLGLFFV